MSNVEALKDRLLSEPIGQLCMINFVDGCACKVIDKALTKEFLNTWAGAAVKLTSLDEVFGGFRLCKESDVKYQSQSGISLDTKVDSLFTVMEYKHIRDHIHDDVSSNDLALANDIYTDFLEADASEWPDLERQLKDLGAINVKLSTSKGLKRSPMSVVWLSTAHPGEPLKEDICYKSPVGYDADTARQNLGLVHIYKKPGEAPPLLVALEIDVDEVPSSLGIWRPTQLDAETHARFRGAFGDLRKRATGWGRTVHLHKLSDKIGELGAPEAVTLNFSPSTMRLWFLGYPRLADDDGSNKNGEFVHKIARGRFTDCGAGSGSSTIAGRFLSLCR